MKKEITAYITGVRNSYLRTIDRLKASGAPITSINSFVAFEEEFSDLLEFVIDIPEDKAVAILNFNFALENENLKKRIRELEESCENMNEVEINPHIQIEELKGDNNVWRIAFDVLKAKLIEAGGKK